MSMCVRGRGTHSRRHWHPTHPKLGAPPGEHSGQRARKRPAGCGRAQPGHPPAAALRRPHLLLLTCMRLICGATKSPAPGSAPVSSCGSSRPLWWMHPGSRMRLWMRMLPPSTRSGPRHASASGPSTPFCCWSTHTHTRLLPGSYGACQMPEGRGHLRKSRLFGPKDSTP